MSGYGDLTQPAEIQLIPAPPSTAGRSRWRAVCVSCGWITRPMSYDDAVRQRDDHDVAHFAAALEGLGLSTTDRGEASA